MVNDIFLNPNDITAFSNQLDATNPYSIASRGIQSWQPNTQSWSGTETGLASFGKAFLGGLLQNYAVNQNAKQVASVNAILPQLMEDPLNTATPEGVNESAFALLKSPAILKKNQRDATIGAARAGNIADLMKSVLTEGVKNGEISPGDAVNAITTGDFSKVINPTAETRLNPNSAKYKTDQDTLTNERNLNSDFTKSDITKDFKYKEQGIKALNEAFKDKSGTSDFELIRRGAQMVEPGLAVRADDEKSLQGAASLFGMTVSALKAVYQGESKLDPEVRAGIMRIARRGYDSTVDDYNTIRTNFLDRASAAALNPASVVPFGAGVTFRQLYPDLNIDPVTDNAVAGASSVTPQTMAQLEQIRDQLRNSNLDPAAKQILVQQAMELTSPKVSASASDILKVR